MREILFRGKRIDNGEWVEGCYAYGGESHYIVVRNDLSNWSYTYQCIEVISETVGQYTGLKDRNGKKIFEGDIVEVNHGEQGKAKGVVVYTDNERGHCGFIVHLNNERWTTMLNDYAAPFPPKILGNIYDNPELLGGENE